MAMIDRKSTRLNSSHLVISYAVFCLKKKNTNTSFTPDSSLTATLASIQQPHADGPHGRVVGPASPQSLLPAGSFLFFFFFFNEPAPTKISPFPQPAPLPI